MWMPGDPHLVTRDMLALLKRGGLIMDVSADPHGAIETSEETTHADPIRVVDGILHYCVQNIPSLFARTSSQMLSAVTRPFVETMVSAGVTKAVEDSPLLRNGVVAWKGALVGADLGRSQGVTVISPDELMERVAAS
jgi:alanine dehydrogenase